MDLSLQWKKPSAKINTLGSAKHVTLGTKAGPVQNSAHTVEMPGLTSNSSCAHGPKVFWESQPHHTIFFIHKVPDGTTAPNTSQSLKFSLII